MKKAYESMKSVLIILLILSLLPAGGLADGIDNWYLLNQRMATRTGPGNTYDEPGTFFRNDYMNTWVQIISKAETNVPWVQVEFTYGGKRMRAYTGAKRIAGLDLSLIPAESVLGYGTTCTTAVGWYGPGKEYAQQNHTVPSGTACTVIQEENDYLLVEYDRVEGEYKLSRSWISAGTLRGYASRFSPSGFVPSQGTPSGSSKPSGGSIPFGSRPSQGIPSGSGKPSGGLIPFGGIPYGSTSPSGGSSSGSTSPSGGSSSGSTTKDSGIREATLWWDEEPDWSYMQVYNVSKSTADISIFFYRIAYIDGTVFLDSDSRNHGYFYGWIDDNTDRKVQGEMWFTETGAAISMNAHQVDPVIEDRSLYWFDYK